MVATLADTLRFLFPKSNGTRDYHVSEGKIIYWAGTLGEQPTDQQLADVSQAVDQSLIKSKLAEIRFERESIGIVVGTQTVTTNRDEMPVWQGMLLDLSVFRPGVLLEYEYKPRGGTNTTLTPTQVARCYECFAWYVGACFATERYLAAQIGICLLYTSPSPRDS